MPMDAIAIPPLQGGRHERHTIYTIADVAQRTRVQDGVHRGAFVCATLVLPPDARTLGGRIVPILFLTGTNSWRPSPAGLPFT
jgi:hypothetical protein